MLTIGVDMGRWKTRAALVQNQDILQESTLPTGSGRKEALRGLTDVIGDVFREEVQGIGIGYPGVIHPSGSILFPGCVPSFKEVNLAEEVRAHYDRPIYVENDANCFAVAEHRYGAGRGISNLIGLIIGGGVGSGIILNGELWKGEYGAAGEIGHSVVDIHSDSSCFCGRGRGHLADLASGPGIVLRYQRKGGKLKDPAQIFSSKETIALTTMVDTYKYIGIGVAHLVNALDISHIVLGGGVSHLPNGFYRMLTKTINNYACRVKGREIKLVKHELPEMNAGVIGAAALAQSRL